MIDEKYQKEVMRATLESQAILAEFSKMLPRTRVRAVPGVPSTSNRSSGALAEQRIKAAEDKRATKARRRI